MGAHLIRMVAFCVVQGAATAAGAAPCAGFTDVQDTSSFCPGVTWLKNRGITQGCATSLYCPANAVTRQEMSAFLSRLQPLLPPSLVDQTGTFVGTLLNAEVTSSWRSFIALSRNGTTYYARLVPGLAAGAVAGYSLEAAALFYADPTCSGQPYLLVRLADYPLSSRFAAIVSPAPGTLRLHAALKPATGIVMLMTWRDPANGVCSGLPGPPFPDAIYQAVDLGPFPFVLPLVVQ